MNLRDLNYFVVLANVKHFGEAARRCFVSQPTLSMQIKKLEEELGVELFERSNKQVNLTDAGKLLLKQAQTVLMDVEQLKQMAQGLIDPFSGELHLGVIPTLAPYLLPHIMPQIQEQFPHLHIWLVEEQTHRLTEQLEKMELDAALMATPISADLHCEPLFAEPFYFACASNFPSQAREFKIADLANQPVMLLAEGHCLREQAMEICQRAKSNPQVDFTATSLETLRLMVQAGRGVTLMPALAVNPQTQPGLKIIPFAEPAPSRTIALYWRKTSPKKQCLLALVELIKAAMTKVLPQDML